MMEDFEKDLKKHFEGRKIQPSENAWERMEALLNEEKTIHKKKRKTYFYLIPIAASVVLFIGIWLSQEKSEIPVLETKTHESFVINDTVIPKKTDSENDNQNRIAEHSLELETINTTNKKQFHNHIIKIKEELFPVKEDKIEQTFATIDIDENELIKENKREMVNVDQKPEVEIKVNASKLLRSAEIERRMENSLTDGQNFWKKVKEINTVVEHRNN